MRYPGKMIETFMGIYGMGYITNYSLYNHYHTRSHKHRASCSAGPCVQHSTLAHCEQGSTQQSTTERRQSSEVAGCRLPCIHWKTLTAGRAHVGHKQTETRHREVVFAGQLTRKIIYIIVEENGCRLPPQGSSVAGP